MGGELAHFISYELTDPFKDMVDENKYIVKGASGQQMDSCTIIKYLEQRNHYLP